MAEVPGIQVKIEGNVAGLKKSVGEAADTLGSLAKSAEAAGKTLATS